MISEEQKAEAKEHGIVPGAVIRGRRQQSMDDYDTALLHFA